MPYDASNTSERKCQKWLPCDVHWSWYDEGKLGRTQKRKTAQYNDIIQQDEYQNVGVTASVFFSSRPTDSPYELRKYQDHLKLNPFACY